MRPAALFLGRSTVRREILGAMLSNPGRRVHVRALARELSRPAAVVGRELAKLEEATILISEMLGPLRLYTFNAEGLFAREIRSVFQKTYGVEQQRRTALEQVSGIRQAFLYGSCVRGTERPDSDVDVFVVGDGVSRKQLNQRLMEVEEQLGREVNLTSTRGSYKNACRTWTGRIARCSRLAAT